MKKQCLDTVKRWLKTLQRKLPLIQNIVLEATSSLLADKTATTEKIALATSSQQQSLQQLVAKLSTFCKQANSVLTRGMWSSSSADLSERAKYVKSSTISVTVKCMAKKISRVNTH